MGPAAPTQCFWRTGRGSLCAMPSASMTREAVPQVEWLKENIGEERIRDLAANRIANGSFSLPALRWLVENRPI